MLQLHERILGVLEGKGGIWTEGKWVSRGGLCGRIMAGWAVNFVDDQLSIYYILRHFDRSLLPHSADHIFTVI